MGMFDKIKKFKFKAKPPELSDYVGRTVTIGGEPVVIETIVGNVGMSLRGEKPKPQFYEINGHHLIGMLRFHAQMTGAKDITEEEFQAFEEMEFHAEKTGESDSPMTPEFKKEFDEALKGAKDVGNEKDVVH